MPNQVEFPFEKARRITQEEAIAAEKAIQDLASMLLE